MNRTDKLSNRDIKNFLSVPSAGYWKIYSKAMTSFAEAVNRRL